jgi:hypothetical protein
LACVAALALCSEARAITFLTTQFDASAVATSHFFGTFLMSAAQPLLVLDFTPTTFASGSGLASTSLFASLTAGATTLFADLTGPWTYGLAPGITYSLDLTLSSGASAGFPSGVVPLTGLAPMVVARKRAAQARGRVA